MFLYAVSLFILSGCIQLNKPLDSQTQVRIKQISFENIVIQDELIVRAQSPGISGAVAGGLIPALIDSSIESKRQEEFHELMSPFYKGTVNFDARAAIALTSEKIKTLCPHTISGTKTTPLALNSDRKIKIQSGLSQNQAFLSLATDYSFSPDFKHLTISALALLWIKESDMEPAYRNILTYVSKPLGNGLKDSTEKWGANFANTYKSTLEMGFGDILLMLAMDLKCIPETPAENSKTAHGHIPASPLPIVSSVTQKPPTIMSGKLLSESPDRVLVRNSNGFLWSLPRAQ